MAMMVSMERRLQAASDGDAEKQFFTHSLQYLTACSGRKVEMENWMITSYEVEFGHQIGSGGLSVLYCGLSGVLLTGSEFTTAGRCSWGLGTRHKLRSRS